EHEWSPTDAEDQASAQLLCGKCYKKADTHLSSCMSMSQVVTMLQNDDDFKRGFKESDDEAKLNPAERSFAPEDVSDTHFFEMVDYREFLKLNEGEVKSLCKATPKKLKLHEIEGTNEVGDQETQYLMIDGIGGPRTAQYRRTRISVGRMVSRRLGMLFHEDHAISKHGELLHDHAVRGMVDDVKIPPSGKKRNPEQGMDWLQRVPKLSKAPAFKDEAPADDTDMDAEGEADGPAASDQRPGRGGFHGGSARAAASGRGELRSRNASPGSAAKGTSYDNSPMPSPSPTPGVRRPGLSISQGGVGSSVAGSTADPAVQAISDDDGEKGEGALADADAASNGDSGDGEKGSGDDGPGLGDDGRTTATSFDACPKDTKGKAMYWKEMNDLTAWLEDKPLGKEYNQAKRLLRKISNKKEFEHEHKMLNRHMQLVDDAKYVSVANISEASEDKMTKVFERLKGARAVFPNKLQMVVLERRLTRKLSGAIERMSTDDAKQIYDLVKPYGHAEKTEFDPLDPTVSSLSSCSRLAFFKDFFAKGIVTPLLDNDGSNQQRLKVMVNYVSITIKLDLRSSAIPERYSNDFFALLTALKVMHCALHREGIEILSSFVGESIAELDEMAASKANSDDIAQVLHASIYDSAFYSSELEDFKRYQKTASKYLEDANETITSLADIASRPGDVLLAGFGEVKPVLLHAFQEFPKWNVSFRPGYMTPVAQLMTNTTLQLFCDYEQSRSHPSKTCASASTDDIKQLVEQAAACFPLDDDLQTKLAQLHSWGQTQIFGQKLSALDNALSSIKASDDVTSEQCAALKVACENFSGMEPTPLVREAAELVYMSIAASVTGHLLQDDPDEAQQRFINEGMLAMTSLQPVVIRHGAPHKNIHDATYNIIRYYQSAQAKAGAVMKLGSDDVERSQHADAEQCCKDIFGAIDGYDKFWDQYKGFNPNKIPEQFNLMAIKVEGWKKTAKVLSGLVVDDCKLNTNKTIDAVQECAGGALEGKSWTDGLQASAKIDAVLKHFSSALCSFDMKAGKAKVQAMDKAVGAYKALCGSFGLDPNAAVLSESESCAALWHVTTAEKACCLALTAKPKLSRMGLQQAVAAEEKKVKKYGGFDKFQPALKERCVKAISFD
ncbi:unnamed protein product, partial [Prorocentrum cordatum]